MNPKKIVIEELKEEDYVEYDNLIKEYIRNEQLKYLEQMIKESMLTEGLNNILTFRKRFIEKYKNDERYGDLIKVLKEYGNEPYSNIEKEYLKGKKLGYKYLVAKYDNQLIGFITVHEKDKYIMDLYSKDENSEVMHLLKLPYEDFKSFTE